MYRNLLFAGRTGDELPSFAAQPSGTPSADLERLEGLGRILAERAWRETSG